MLSSEKQAENEMKTFNVSDQSLSLGENVRTAQNQYSCFGGENEKTLLECFH
jgi:hypothetical protein